MTLEDINLKIKNFLDGALRKFFVQDYNEAIRELKAAEVLDKNNPEILYNLGINYTRLGLYKTAVKYFQRLKDLPVAFVEIQEIRKITAYVYIKLSEYNSAESLLNEAIRFQPSDSTAHSMKGYCLEKRGNIEEAILAYQAIIDLEGDNINACNSLAFLLASAGKDLDRALSLAKKACKAFPDNPSYCDTLGFVLIQKKNLKMQRNSLKKPKLSPLSKEIQDHLDILKGI